MGLSREKPGINRRQQAGNENKEFWQCITERPNGEMGCMAWTWGAEHVHFLLFLFCLDCLARSSGFLVSRFTAVNDYLRAVLALASYSVLGAWLGLGVPHLRGSGTRYLGPRIGSGSFSCSTPRLGVARCDGEDASVLLRGFHERWLSRCLRARGRMCEPSGKCRDHPWTPVPRRKVAEPMVSAAIDSDCSLQSWRGCHGQGNMCMRFLLGRRACRMEQTLFWVEIPSLP